MALLGIFRRSRVLDGRAAYEIGLPESSTEAAYNDALADVFWALLNSAEFSLNH